MAGNNIRGYTMNEIIKFDIDPKATDKISSSHSSMTPIADDEGITAIIDNLVSIVQCAYNDGYGAGYQAGMIDEMERHNLVYSGNPFAPTVYWEGKIARELVIHAFAPKDKDGDEN
jgi:hypothetical protein